MQPVKQLLRLTQIWDMWPVFLSETNDTKKLYEVFKLSSP